MANKKNQTQSEKFKEAAKKIGTQAGEVDFDNALKKIAKSDLPREGQQKSNEAKGGGE